MPNEGLLFLSREASVPGVVDAAAGVAVDLDRDRDEVLLGPVDVDEDLIGELLDLVPFSAALRHPGSLALRHRGTAASSPAGEQASAPHLDVEQPVTAIVFELE